MDVPKTEHDLTGSYNEIRFLTNMFPRCNMDNVRRSCIYVVDVRIKRKQGSGQWRPGNWFLFSSGRMSEVAAHPKTITANNGRLCQGLTSDNHTPLITISC